jgi:uncharacterized protein (DUF2141 family)
MFLTAALFIAAPVAVAPSEAGTVAISVAGLRNKRGTVLFCMTRHRSHFPDCRGDPAALSRSVPAATPTAEFPDVPLGDYAIAVFHDENNNRKLDTVLGIPREGFGFSRNPKIGFGAPRFDKVDIRIGAGLSRLAVRIQYIL